jgi:ATP-dependent helicase/nuclease subunit A
VSLLPDQKARDCIERDLDLNIVVEASAGSGKTESLTRRIVHALTDRGLEVESVVVVTFTRKAAAELKSRVRIALEEACLSGRSSHTKSRAMACLSQLENLFVGTIHSFCSTVLREHPVEAGVSPGFGELEPFARDQLLEASLTETLDRLSKESPSLPQELTRLGVRTRDYSGSLATLCDHPDVLFEAPFVEMPDLSKVEDALHEFRSDLAQLMPGEIAPKTTCRVQKAWRLLQHRIKFAREDDPAALAYCLEPWVGGLKPVQKFWPGSGAERKEHCLLVQETVEDFFVQVVEPFRRRWRAYLYARIIEVLSEARGDFENKRRRLGQLDYSDLLVLAAQLLRNDLAVRRKLQKKYRMILVDEFQDTDPLQAEILLLLASEPSFQGDDWRLAPLRQGAIFLVGDPKQSIYRFRRADIDLFENVKSQVLASGGEAVALTSSFRSLGPLCQWTNRVFSSLFPDEAVAGQAAFSPLESVREAQTTLCSGVYTLTDQSERYQDVSSQLGRRLALLLEEAVSRGEYSWGDFMILTCKRGEIGCYSRALEERRIPVEITGGTAQDWPWVRHFKSLLNVLSDPDNSVAAVGVLRGPLYGIDDETLFQHRLREGHFLFELPCPNGHELVQGALNDLKQMSQWIRSMPVGAAAEKILDHTGVLASASVSNQGEGDVPALLQLIEQVRQLAVQGYSLIQILESLELRQADYPVSLSAGEQNVVRVMNLHQAKGLQARVVILVSPTAGLPQRAQLRLVRTDSETRGFLTIRQGYNVIAEPVDWDDIAAEELAQLQHESTRLLYVAATRARDLMIVTRWAGTHRRPTRPWEPFEPFLNEAEELLWQVSQRTLEPRALPSLEEADSASLERMARWTAVAKPTWHRTSVTALRQSQNEGESENASAEGAKPCADQDTESGHGKAWGDLVHKLLEQVVKDPKLSDSQLTNLAGWYTFENPELKELIPAAIKTIRTVMTSELWGQIRGSDRYLTEVPFGVIERDGELKTLVFGVVDLALQNGEDWCLVDYKTDHKPLDQLATTYSSQLQQYARYWERLAGPVESAKIFRVRSGELSGDLGGLGNI